MKKLSKKLMAAICTSALMVGTIGCSSSSGGGAEGGAGSAGGGSGSQEWPDALHRLQPLEGQG